ncbi:MAG TPA: phosphate/phosphite/phosphonate ABC transporter substrate-binding protein [Thermoanaerobaculia bacterium]|nr:phosphate/phosphite/phosphonate ABC transporter substrate-binding protein [Thermoanaerobaculia bacterium]
MAKIRLLSYLAPSIPSGLFELVAEEIERRTGVAVALDFETTVSGPTPEADPFAQGRADIAFVCGPSLALLRAAGRPVEIVAAAPVFDDPRNGGRPVYFSDVVVGRDHPAGELADLRRSVWTYNDRQSLSGWFRMLSRLEALGFGRDPDAFFARAFASGSHLSSIDLVARGEADVSAVDSNTLLLARRRRPDLDERLRVLETWGPSPVQPLIARSGLPAPLPARIAAALLGMGESPEASRRLREFGVLRFAPVREQDYDGLAFDRS